MTAPKITGAIRVHSRYGAGVYRFNNDRGLSVALHHDPDNDFVRDPDRFDAVPIEFHGPNWDDFTVAGFSPRSFGIDADQLAELALDVRRQR